MHLGVIGMYFKNYTNYQHISKKCHFDPAICKLSIDNITNALKKQAYKCVINEGEKGV